jgi:hypothetical protein
MSGGEGIDTMTKQPKTSSSRKAWIKRDADRQRAIEAMSAEDREAIRLRLEKRFAAKAA